MAGQFARKLLQFLFYFHLLLITILAIFLTLRGVVLSQKHHFHPRRWYPPLLTSIASAGVFSFAWQWITYSCPSKAIKICFWLGPLSTCAVGIVFLLISSAACSAVGAIFIISAFIQTLYTCWVNPRFEYAAKILQVSLASPPAKTTFLVILSIVTSAVYACLLVSGIGGATAIGTKLDILFILVILLSLAWSMQVIKNILQVIVSRIKYIHFAYGADMDTLIVFRDTMNHLVGSVCVGSILVPIFGVTGASGRGISLIAGDTDEFLFSCAKCYSNVASTLEKHGNWWGFVQLAVYNKGFVQASVDTWEMFRQVGLETLINSDLTGAFCFFSGVMGGGVCTLVGGSWTLLVQKSYTAEVSIYAFFIGYFTVRDYGITNIPWLQTCKQTNFCDLLVMFQCRIALAWPQACVSAYYVAYAQNPQSLRFDSTIPVRIQELQRYQT